MQPSHVIILLIYWFVSANAQLSYLHKPARSSNVGLFSKSLLEYLHKQQHPPRNQCKSNRLLVLSMSNSLEGIGSITRDIMIGLAIAAHSNRTVVWGLHQPLLFELTREAWLGEYRHALHVGDSSLDCTGGGRNAGPYNCFFDPISSCSLEDVTAQELIGFSKNPYNESSRIMMVEVRKAISLYVPPLQLFDQIFHDLTLSAAAQNLITTKQSHIWSSVCAAYAFRIKFSLIQDYEDRRSFPEVHPSWGLHVRHGEIKSHQDVYGYKKVFEFKEFFKAAVTLSHVQQLAPLQLFVATDSAASNTVPGIYKNFIKNMSHTVNNKSCRGNKAYRYECMMRRFYDDDEGRDERAQQGLEQVPRIEDVPKLVQVVASDRYRTHHGSLTVAADGGCVTNPELARQGLGICAIRNEAMDEFRHLPTHTSVSKPMRVMRVLYEAIEDLYLLSKCDSIIGQGTSYYSSMAAMLIWVRTDFDGHLNRVMYLDQQAVACGESPTSYMPFSHDISLGKNIVRDGKLRWKDQTNIFISGLESVFNCTMAHTLGLPCHSHSVAQNHIIKDNPWHDRNLMKMKQAIPYISSDIFHREARQWRILPLHSPSQSALLPDNHSNTDMQSNDHTEIVPGSNDLWPGQCAADGFDITSLIYLNIDDTIIEADDDLEAKLEEFAIAATNVGVEHLETSHPGDAMQCWAAALHALNLQRNLQMQRHNQRAIAIASKDTNNDLILHSKHDNWIQAILVNSQSLHSQRYAKLAALA